MSFYERHILPWMIHHACGARPLMRQRARVVPLASGRVLEIGAGSGHNLPLYDPARVECVWALEPSEGMRARAAANLRKSRVGVQWLDLPGERVPLEDCSVDTVLMTYTLCTIPDWRAALGQMRRVLKPEGRLIFLEHGAAPEPGVRRWQDRLNGGWQRIGGGCNLNREIPALIESAGFRITRGESAYLPGTPRTMGFNYWGEATPA